QVSSHTRLITRFPPQCKAFLMESACCIVVALRPGHHAEVVQGVGGCSLIPQLPAQLQVFAAKGERLDVISLYAGQYGRPVERPGSRQLESSKVGRFEG